jgi:adenylate cyclase
MATEIERKFLLANDSWRRDVTKSSDIRQGYLLGSSSASVRVRISGEQANLNIKSATLGVTRKEYEIPLSIDDAMEMLDDLCDKPVIEKTRHIVTYKGHTWEIDEFYGDNQGLVVAEIELTSEDEDFEKPNWVGAEVSDDTRYYNVCLIQHPYKEW